MLMIQYDIKDDCILWYLPPSSGCPVYRYHVKALRKCCISTLIPVAESVSCARYLCQQFTSVSSMWVSAFCSVSSMRASTSHGVSSLWVSASCNISSAWVSTFCGVTNTWVLAFSVSVSVLQCQHLVWVSVAFCGVSILWHQQSTMSAFHVSVSDRQNA